MDCQASDSKKLYQVFEASKRKNKKRDELEESFSLGTDESKSQKQPFRAEEVKIIVDATRNPFLVLLDRRHGTSSAKASLQDLTNIHGDGLDELSPKRGCGSSTASPSPELVIHRAPRMRLPRRRHRRPQDDVSLALNAGLHSTPRSNSPHNLQDNFLDGATGKDRDSYIYTYLEEAIKKDKKRNRMHRFSHRTNDRSRDHDRITDLDRDQERSRDRSRDQERSHDQERSRDRERSRDHARSRDRDRHGSDSDHHREHSPSVRKHHNHSHRRRHHDNVSSRDQHDKSSKNPTCIIDQTMLLETFAKLCSSLSEKTTSTPPQIAPAVVRTQSHKSLQCEVESRSLSYDVDQQPVRLRSQEQLTEGMVSKTRVQSQEEEEKRSDQTMRQHDSRSCLRLPPGDKYYEKSVPRYGSKLDLVPSKARDLVYDKHRDHDQSHDYYHTGERDYPAALTRSCVDHSYRRERRERRDYRCRDDRRYPFRERRDYADDKRKCCEKTSRSFDVHRELYPEDFRRTARSDSHTKKNYEEVRDDGRERRYEDRRNDDRRERYIDERERGRPTYHGGGREFRSRRYIDRLERTSVVSRDEPERVSEHERDSCLNSVADDVSTLSGRSHYLRSVKQEIFEQRDAMDNMMKLWKELMRCFKSLAQNQNPSDGNKTIHESAATMQESAEAQLRLWRECMHRYETVARDVGDTDARLMEEIAKQRSEMAEMSTMWQECLQRYRDMSNEFNTLKRQLVSETPSRQAAPAQESPVRPPLDAESTGFSSPYRMRMDYPPPPMPAMVPGFPSDASPQRSRSVAPPPPPPWWWAREPPRRRSSPDSRENTPRNNTPRNTTRFSPSRDRHDRRHHHKEREEPRYKKSSSKHTGARSDHKHRKQ